jgi:hypothetical protein
MPLEEAISPRFERMLIVTFVVDLLGEVSRAVSV